MEEVHSSNLGSSINLNMDTQPHQVLETDRVVIKEEVESIFLSEIKQEAEDHFDYDEIVEKHDDYKPIVFETVYTSKLEIEDSSMPAGGEEMIVGDDPMFDAEEDFYDTSAAAPCSSTSILEDSSENSNNYCQPCNKQFRRRSAFLSHLRVHSFDEEEDLDEEECNYFACDTCGKKIKSKIGLEKHKETHLKKNLCCELCNFKTRNIYVFNMHVQKHSKNEVLYKCRLCDFETKNAVEKSEHLKLHELNNSLQSEVNEQQSTVYQCRECNYQTKDLNEKREHTLEHRSKHHPFSKMDIKCGDCSAMFVGLTNFFVHRKIHSESECSECFRKIRSKTFKQFHQTLDFGEFTYSCSLCKSEFLVKPASNASDKIHTESECNECGEKFALPSSKFNHKLKHCIKKDVQKSVPLTKQVYKCGLCEKNFNGVVEYTSHMVVHWKSDKGSQKNGYDKAANLMSQYRKQSHTCKQCKKNFDSIVEYSRHMIVHWKSDA